jgi:hypothetical protein
MEKAMLIYLSFLFYALKCYIVKYFYLIIYFSGHIFTVSSNNQVWGQDKEK